MGGQNATRSEIRTTPNAAVDGKLEQFLPYRLNVVAAPVSEAPSPVYARRYRIGIPDWRVRVTLGQFGVMTLTAAGRTIYEELASQAFRFCPALTEILTFQTATHSNALCSRSPINRRNSSPKRSSRTALKMIRAAT
jgi:hypothetical protein